MLCLSDILTICMSMVIVSASLIAAKYRISYLASNRCSGVVKQITKDDEPLGQGILLLGILLLGILYCYYHSV